MTAHNLDVFTPASHFEVLVLITQLTILLFTARTLGELVQKLGYPAVIGELSAGIFLGPSFLGHYFPQLAKFIIPQTLVQGYLIETISLIGVIFLLLLTGLETDINLIRRNARIAIGAAAGGLFLPLLIGFILGHGLPAYLLVNPEKRIIFSLFIATAMSISAIPVIARILFDLNLIRRNIGQTIIAAAMIDDTIGWILLSIVAGLASGHVVNGFTIFNSFAVVAIFMIFSYTLGRWFVKKLLDYTQDRVTSKDALLTLVVVMTFAWACISHALHLEPALGAFVMGIIFSQMPRLPVTVHQKIESMAMAIFAPIFFAVAGLKVNIFNLLTPELITITLLVIFTAIFGKIIGTYLGARFIGRKDHWTALSLGAALNARGAMEIIVATIGLSLGILTQEMFSIIVLMAMTTSFMAPFLLRWTLRHLSLGKDELYRLQDEALSQTSPIWRIYRVLLPVRRRDSIQSQEHYLQNLKAQLLQKMGHNLKLSITLLNIDKPDHRFKNSKFLDDIGKHFKKHELIKKTVAHDNIPNAILDEAQKNYDLLVIGSSEKKTDSEYLFSNIVDTLVRLSPCITLILHANQIPKEWPPKRILVPADESQAAKHAAEFAFLLASSGHELVKIISVLERDQSQNYFDLPDDIFQRQLKTAVQNVTNLKELGKLKEINAEIDVQVGLNAHRVILEAAEKNKIDLIILGTDVGAENHRIFLGKQIETILKEAACPVIILNTP